MLWISVVPASPKRDDGLAVASKSRELLRESNIVGGEVEVRKSVVTRTAGSKFLPPDARRLQLEPRRQFPQTSDYHARFLNSSSVLSLGL